MADSAEALYERGNDAYVADRLDEAVALYRAAVRALLPADDELARDLYENLGVALWRLGRWRPASFALARALDGDGAAREQCARLLVGCLFRSGRALDGERHLAAYERTFGRHPEGWSRVG
jgi:tetratricopeptide (TPR) repeat protein